MADSIVYQSVRDSAGNAVQQISNLSLTGLTTLSGQTQHTHGRLYGQFVQVSGSKVLSTGLENYDFSFPAGGYILAIYADPTRFNLVAVASNSTFGVAQITAVNNSGLGGTVNLIDYTADDLFVEVVALLSTDDDLPQDYLSAFPEYDATLGFATFHQQAFGYVTDFIKGREKASLWNPTLISTTSTNGALGGYDTSKVLNWQSPSLVDASAHYAFYRLCERQYVEPGSVWDVRAKEARNLVRAHLEDADVSIDSTGNRVETKQRSLTSWRLSRA